MGEEPAKDKDKEGRTVRKRTSTSYQPYIHSRAMASTTTISPPIASIRRSNFGQNSESASSSTSSKSMTTPTPSPLPPAAWPKSSCVLTFGIASHRNRARQHHLHSRVRPREMRLMRVHGPPGIYIYTCVCLCICDISGSRCTPSQCPRVNKIQLPYFQEVPDQASRIPVRLCTQIHFVVLSVFTLDNARVSATN